MCFVNFVFFKKPSIEHLLWASKELERIVLPNRRRHLSSKVQSHFNLEQKKAFDPHMIFQKD